MAGRRAGGSRDHQFFGHVAGGTVEDHDVGGVGVLFVEGLEEHLEGLGVQAGQPQQEVLPTERLHSHEEAVGLEGHPEAGAGLDAPGSETSALHGVQSEAALVLEEEAGLAGLAPVDVDAQEAGEVFFGRTERASSFFTWGLRAAFSLAWRRWRTRE